MSCLSKIENPEPRLGSATQLCALLDGLRAYHLTAGARDAIAAQPVLCGWTVQKLDIYPRFKPLHRPITDVMDLDREQGRTRHTPRSCHIHCPEKCNWGPRPCPVSRPGTPLTQERFWKLQASGSLYGVADLHSLGSASWLARLLEPGIVSR